MKRYLLKKEYNVEEMSQREAEKKLNRPLQNKYKSDKGYLMIDADNLSFDWIPEADLKIIPYDTCLEKTLQFSKDILEWQRTFHAWTKEKPTMSVEERSAVYSANRHIKVLSAVMQKILTLNVLETNSKKL